MRDINKKQDVTNKEEKLKKFLFAALSLLLVSACSTMQPPRYSVSVDNIQRLKNYEGAKIQVVSLNQSAKFDPNCRFMGPIEPADGLTCPQFISKAFNDELKMAGLYSTDGVRLTGDITRIEFSSTSGLTNGYWDIGLELQSSNGESLSVSNKFTFKSGFDAITACNATADALAPAVQDLINAAVTHPDFIKLLNNS
jgi:hypothetical protein